MDASWRYLKSFSKKIFHHRCFTGTTLSRKAFSILNILEYSWLLLIHFYSTSLSICYIYLAKISFQIKNAARHSWQHKGYERNFCLFEEQLAFRETFFSLFFKKYNFSVKHIFYSVLTKLQQKLDNVPLLENIFIHFTEILTYLRIVWKNEYTSSQYRKT